MSKKHKFSKHIQKGRFYHMHEGSPTGHPGMIYWKNDKKNLYLAIKIGTSNGSHRVPIRPTGETVKESYIFSRPILAKRRNMGGERNGLKIDKRDIPLIKAISRRPYVPTNDINRKDKRYLKNLKKKPRY